MCAIVVILIELSQMKAIVNDPSTGNIPAPADVLRKLNNIVHEAEECVVVAGRLTRRRGLRGFASIFTSFSDRTLYASTTKI